MKEVLCMRHYKLILSRTLTTTQHKEITNAILCSKTKGSVKEKKRQSEILVALERWRERV